MKNSFILAIDMKYCSDCGSSRIIFKIPQGDERKRFICEDCNRIYYSNPLVIVGCIVENHNKIMLCRRGIEPRKGFWNLPAGFLENGETVEQGALRETWEESSCEVEIEGLHCVYNVPHANQVYFIFKSKLKVQLHYEGEETTEIQFFEKDQIPWAEIAFNSNIFALKHYLGETSSLKHEVFIGTFSGKLKS
jgi:ADP-ribose pyrophosphatase YjhB (NUDIX family)